MAEAVEGGAVLAWRLLATLEGGSLLLATSALLAYTVRKRLARIKRTRRPIKSVLITNSTDTLGQELKTQLESRGCVVRTASSVASSAIADAINGVGPAERVDALVIVGAHSAPKPGLQAMADLVTEDVYNNLKSLESLSVHVRRGGCVAWACAGAAPARFRAAGDAFDNVLKANLQRVAQLSECEAVWVGRGADASDAARQLAAALVAPERGARAGFTIRNAAHKVGERLGRWLKIVT